MDLLQPARMDFARAKIASPTVLPRVSRLGARCTIRDSINSFIGNPEAKASLTKIRISIESIFCYIP